MFTAAFFSGHDDRPSLIAPAAVLGTINWFARCCYVGAAVLADAPRCGPGSESAARGGAAAGEVQALAR